MRYTLSMWLNSLIGPLVQDINRIFAWVKLSLNTFYISIGGLSTENFATQTFSKGQAYLTILLMTFAIAFLVYIGWMAIVFVYDSLSTPRLHRGLMQLRYRRSSFLVFRVRIRVFRYKKSGNSPVKGVSKKGKPGFANGIKPPRMGVRISVDREKRRPKKHERYTPVSKITTYKQYDDKGRVTRQTEFIDKPSQKGIRHTVDE